MVSFWRVQFISLIRVCVYNIELKVISREGENTFNFHEISKSKNKKALNFLSLNRNHLSFVI